MEKDKIKIELKKIEQKFRLPGFILFTKNRNLREKYYNLLEKLYFVDNNDEYFLKNKLGKWKTLLNL